MGPVDIARIASDPLRAADDERARENARAVDVNASKVIMAARRILFLLKL
jgi:hypothetical protein